MRSTWAWLVLACVTLTACEAATVEVPPTTVFVRISATSEVQTEMSKLRLRVASNASGSWAVEQTQEFAASELQWPVDYPVTSTTRASASSLFEIVVEALDAKSESLVQSRAISGFVPKQTRVLEMELEACGDASNARGLGFVCENKPDCIGEGCARCVNGECVATMPVDPNELGGLREAGAGPGVDAGGGTKMDAATDGAQATDAADASADPDGPIIDADIVADATMTDAAHDATPLACYPDTDMDGFAPLGSIPVMAGVCTPMQTTIVPGNASTADCNPNLGTIHPGATENCNGADDDCDVMCDDGFACCKGTVSSCTSSCGTTGTSTCSASCAAGACIPPVETCNGTDDDCDSMCDDGFACCKGAVSSCTASCGTTGTSTCSAACAVGACIPPTETCNGTDDDCDGTCDDGFACCRGSVSGCTSSCGTAGSRTCTASCGMGTCTPPGETCNADDDDCDGNADNGFTCAKNAPISPTTVCGISCAQTCNSSCSGPASTCTLQQTVFTFRGNQDMFHDGTNCGGGCIGTAWCNFEYQIGCFAAFGPDAGFPPGNYKVDWLLSGSAASASYTLDVVSNSSGNVVAGPVTVSGFTSATYLPLGGLSFTVPNCNAGQTYQFRAVWNGGGAGVTATVQEIRVTRQGATFP